MNPNNSFCFLVGLTVWFSFMLTLCHFFAFGEDPVFVPEEAPDREEAGRNEETDVRRDTNRVQAANN